MRLVIDRGELGVHLAPEGFDVVQLNLGHVGRARRMKVKFQAAPPKTCAKFSDCLA